MKSTVHDLNNKGELISMNNDKSSSYYNLKPMLQLKT